MSSSTLSNKINANNLIGLVLTIGLGLGLYIFGSKLEEVQLLEFSSEKITHFFSFQILSTIIAIIFLFLLKLLRPTIFKSHFNWGNQAAKIVPEPLVGIKPKANETWKQLGRKFAFIITFITFLVIFLQIALSGRFSFPYYIKMLPLILLFALTNSFIEEAIFRMGIVVSLKDVLSDQNIALISGVFFGCCHYYGMPGGIGGILLTGFLGWFLAKSILETKGVFWAWFIHFLQDVVVMSAFIGIE